MATAAALVRAFCAFKFRLVTELGLCERFPFFKRPEPSLFVVKVSCLLCRAKRRWDEAEEPPLLLPLPLLMLFAAPDVSVPCC